MKKQEEGKQKSSRLKLATIILAVLLGISAGGLVARYLYLTFFSPAQMTVTVPNNLIGEDPDSRLAETALERGPAPSRPSDSGASTERQATVLELYQGSSGDNEKFEVHNMLPGDSVTEYFCVRVSHDADIDVFFRAEVTEQTKSLGDVLQIKVTHLESGKVLSDAPFSEIDGREFSEILPQNIQNETVARYQIDVALDTSGGNQYQAALLKADFNWYVKDDGGLIPPQTGDPVNIILWAVLVSSSLLLIVLLLLGRRKERGRTAGAKSWNRRRKRLFPA